MSWAWGPEALSWVSSKADGLLETTCCVGLLNYEGMEALGLRWLSTLGIVRCVGGFWMAEYAIDVKCMASTLFELHY